MAWGVNAKFSNRPIYDKRYGRGIYSLYQKIYVRMEHQGKTCATELHKSKTREKIGKINGESGENVRKYIRLTYLIPELLRKKFYFKREMFYFL